MNTNTNDNGPPSRKQTFNSYVYKVLKQVHPDTGSTSATKVLMDRFVYNCMDRICREATAKKVTSEKNSTLTTQDLLSATRVVLSGEVAKHAVSEAVRAVTRFSSSYRHGRRKKRQSDSSKAGLQFPVERLARYMTKGGYSAHMGGYFDGFAHKVEESAPVCLAAVLEYLVAEVLELSGNSARDNKRSFIRPRHVELAVRSDEELNKLFAESNCKHLYAAASPTYHVPFGAGRNGSFAACCSTMQKVVSMLMVRRKESTTQWDRKIPVHVRRYIFSFLPISSTEKEWLEQDNRNNTVRDSTTVFMQAAPLNLRTTLSFEEIYGSEENIKNTLNSISTIKRVIKAVNFRNRGGQSSRSLIKHKGNGVPHITLTGNRDALVKKLRAVVMSK